LFIFWTVLILSTIVDARLRLGWRLMQFYGMLELETEDPEAAKQRANR